VHQAHAHALAGEGERRRRHVVDPVVGLAAALAQDAGGVEHGAHVPQQRAPDVAGGEGFQVDFAQVGVAQRGRQFREGALRVARADDHRVPAAAQRGGRMPPDEAGAAQDQNVHFIILL
jgi:hypothetical protein